jgi:hypothetical protein
MLSAFRCTTSRYLVLLSVAALMTIGSLRLAGGCGGLSPSTTTQSTAAGTYTVVVTANAVDGAAAVTQQFTATVTVAL